MADSLADLCAQLLEELGLATPNDITDVTPLTGGVASDIARVQAGDRVFCVKFALPKLKVAADWFAPVHRNAGEYAWLSVAGGLCPGSAVRLYGRSDRLHGFAMEFIGGDDVFLWKDRLLSQGPIADEAVQVAALLGRVHQASSKADFDSTPFQNRDDFHAIRIEPYLTYTASKNPSLAAPMMAMADGLYAADTVLIHGDASPKNILFRAGAPIVLDAECATMGDPAFDLGFCVNHLILKSIHMPDQSGPLLQSVLELWTTYRPFVDWESEAKFERRLAHLIPMLMLARVDGKSPVEYLTAPAQSKVRDLSIPLIAAPVATLAELITAIKENAL